MVCRESPTYTCDTISAEDLNRMTLQVGFVGTDGIVLASDTLVNVLKRAIIALVTAASSSITTA